MPKHQVYTLRFTLFVFCTFILGYTPFGFASQATQQEAKITKAHELDLTSLQRSPSFMVALDSFISKQLSKSTSTTELQQTLSAGFARLVTDRLQSKVRRTFTSETLQRAKKLDDDLVQQYLAPYLIGTPTDIAPEFWPALQLTLAAHDLFFVCKGAALFGLHQNGTLLLWDAKTFKLLEAPAKEVMSIQESDDQRFLFIFHADHSVTLIDSTSEDLRCKTIKLAGYTTDACMSPNHQFLIVVTGIARYAQIYTRSTGEPIGNPIPDIYYDRITISPDSQFFVAITQKLGMTCARAQIYRLATGEAVGRPIERVNGVQAMSSDGRFVVIGHCAASGQSPYSVRMYALATGEPLGNSFNDTKYAEISSDSKYLLVVFANNTAQFYNSTTGQALRAPLALHETYGRDNKMAIISPRGDSCIAVLPDCSAQLYAIETGQPIGQAIRDVSIGLQPVRFSANGALFSVCFPSQIQRLYHAETGKVCDGNLVGTIELLPHNLFLFGPEKDTITGRGQLHDANSGKVKGHPVLHIVGQRSSYRFSHASSDGTYAVFCSCNKASLCSSRRAPYADEELLLQMLYPEAYRQLSECSVEQLNFMIDLYKTRKYKLNKASRAGQYPQIVLNKVQQALFEQLAEEHPFFAQALAQYYELPFPQVLSSSVLTSSAFTKSTSETAATHVCSYSSSAHPVCSCGAVVSGAATSCSSSSSSTQQANVTASSGTH